MRRVRTSNFTVFITLLRMCTYNCDINHKTNTAKSLISNVNWLIRVHIYNTDSAKLFIDRIGIY